MASLPLACRSCLSRFDVPFEQRTGLWACAASFVGKSCRRALGCATDCLTTSCDQCSEGSESACTTLVSSSPIGQCAPYTGSASCATLALTSGVCSQFSYASFGAWLRGVGDHFCGDGP
jgi:hypothetical protein